MEKKTFKKLFDKIACNNSFESAFNGWFKESKECLVALELQKSNYGNYYYLNIKIFVQGSFGQHYSKSSSLITKEVGDFFRRAPKEYEDAFNFDLPIEDSKRIEKFNDLFTNFLIPFTEKALTKEGIKVLIEDQSIALLPAVKKELGF